MLSPEQQKVMDAAREKLAKIKLTRTRAITDAGRVRGGDPKKHYSWVNDHPERVKFFEALEYRICKNQAISKNHPDWAREDGTIQRGDLILMEIDKDIYDGIKYSELLDAAESRDDAERVFLTFADRHNVPTFQPQKG